MIRLKPHWKNKCPFCIALYLCHRRQDFSSTNSVISLLWPSALTTEVLGALCAALWWLEINWISDLPRGRKKPQFVAVCKVHSGKSSVDEETLTSSYQQTEQRSFDPSPEPPLNRLAELCDDGEWDAVVGPQIAALRLFSCHFLRTVWINTLSLLYPVCGNIWQAGAPDLIC